jgi:DNA-binding NtrC family response regulator
MSTPLKAFVTALARQTWDIVIADYSLPHFSGLAALTLLKESGLDLPFIVRIGQVNHNETFRCHSG